MKHVLQPLPLILHGLHDDNYVQVLRAQQPRIRRNYWKKPISGKWYLSRGGNVMLEFNSPYDQSPSFAYVPCMNYFIEENSSLMRKENCHFKIERVNQITMEKMKNRSMKTAKRKRRTKLCKRGGTHCLSVLVIISSPIWGTVAAVVISVGLTGVIILAPCMVVVGHCLA